MALFIRKRPPERCHRAELEVAEFLAELDDDWLVRWGFTYSDNRGARREGDFLVSGPHGGILVLEVKGGTVSLNPYSGRWNTADGDDPSFQLDEEWSDVVRTIGDHQGGRPSVYVGRALGTPDLTIAPRTGTHYGIPREFLFDRSDLRSFANAFDLRMRGWGARMSRTDRQVFESAYGNEGAPKSIRHFIDDIDRTLLRHTEAGFSLLDQLAGNRRFLVSGGAGTGKTWLALELARRWAADDGQDVLLLAYNLGLTGELRSLVQRMQTMRRIPRGSITVLAWEDLIRRLFSDASLPYEPPAEPEAQRHFFEQAVPGLLRDLVAGGHIRAQFDAMVVDEGQDHDTSGPGDGATGWWPAYFRLLRQGGSSPVAVFHDGAQRPSFRAGRFEIESLLATWGVDPVHIRLCQSIRYTQQVYKYLRDLPSPELQSLQSGLGTQPVWHQGVDVEHVKATTSDTPAAVAGIVSRWVNQGWARPEQVLILTRRGTHDRSSLKGLSAVAGFPLAWDFHPARGSVGFGSVNRAKGLDRLAIIVIDFPAWDEMPSSEHVPFFMGVSRARQLLAVVSTVAQAPAGP